MTTTLGTEPVENRKTAPWAFYVALCLLGPLFFLSYAFTILSPLPLLYLHSGNPRKKEGRVWALVALALGISLSAAVKGWGGGIGFFLLAGLPALVLGEGFLRKLRPEGGILSAFVAICAASLVIGFGSSAIGKFDLLAASRTAVETQVKAVAEKILQQNPDDLPEQTQDELKDLIAHPNEIYQELPGLLAAALLMLCTLPCLALIRWNPKGFLRRSAISRDFLRKWKSPDWFVWVALFCGVFLIFPLEPLASVANNLLKPILLIYFFQGMSILAYFLDSLRLRGPLRILVYGAGILFLTPMVVSFGFFDLWFNFRGRHKAPNEEKES